MQLNIFKLNEQTGEYGYLDTIERDTAQECFDTAEYLYGNNNDYHWTNPFQIKSEAGFTGEFIMITEQQKVIIILWVAALLSMIFFFTALGYSLGGWRLP